MKSIELWAKTKKVSEFMNCRIVNENVMINDKFKKTKLFAMFYLKCEFALQNPFCKSE